MLLAVALIAAAAQVVHDPRGDAHMAPPGVSGGQDILSASAMRIDGRQVHTIRTTTGFRTSDAPCLEIVHRPHTLFVCGQGAGEFVGTGPCPCPKARITRPSRTSVRYSFSARALHLRGSYRWYVRSSIVGLDRAPDRGTVRSPLP